MPIVTAVDDIIELKLVGNYGLVQEHNNIFHYKVTNVGTGTGAPATLEEWAAGFMSEVLPDITGLLSDVMTFTNIEARLLDPVTGALINGVPVAIDPSLGVPANTGDALPPANCWTFRYNRPDASFRHGYKRFSGILEASQNQGIAVGGIVTGLANTALQLETPLEAWTLDAGLPDVQVTGAAAVPVVLQRVKNGDILNPINVAEIADIVYTHIGTQNSRKFGVGS